MCSTCAPMSPKSPEANERTHLAPWCHGRKLKTKPWCAVTLEGPSETAVGSVRGQRQPPRDPAARCPAGTAAQPGVRTRTHLRPCWATHTLPTHVKVLTEMRVTSAASFSTCLPVFWFLKYCILGSVTATVPEGRMHHFNIFIIKKEWKK